MAREEVKLGEPPAMGVASAAILMALIDELINQGIVSREAMERVLSITSSDIGHQGTRGAFAEARTFVNSLRDNLPSP
jgi:hypothetical protein